LQAQFKLLLTSCSPKNSRNCLTRLPESAYLADMTNLTTHAHNPFEEVNEKVKKAGEFLKLKPGLVEVLTSCEREVVISIPLRRQNDVEVLTGYRVQHSSARGPRVAVDEYPHSTH
jgi:hypothetical protein